MKEHIDKLDAAYLVQETPDLYDTTGKLDDLTISFKDNIVIRDVESTAGSAILEGYKSRFNATVVTRILANGGRIIGKTTMDEFGFGSFNLNVPETRDVPPHPEDSDRVTGGSSGGAAAVTRRLDNHVAVAESTGGSIVNPAAFCGVIGFCPTYGLVSRHGLISYANSLDKIGVMANTANDARRVFDVMSGPDDNDQTCVDQSYETNEVQRIGVLHGDCSDTVTATFKSAIEQLDASYTLESVETSFVETYGLAAYYIISMSEASTNLAKYCGLRYGKTGDPRGKHFTEYFTAMRDVFTDEAKRRIQLGTAMRQEGYRDKYYEQALKARTCVIEEYRTLFDEYDLLISPTMPMVAPTIDEATSLSPVETYAMDILTVGPNLAGLPHGSLPIGKGLPKGLLVIGDHFQDGTVLDFIEQHEGTI